MTRYINLCRDTAKKEDTKPIPLEDPPTKYERYKDNYEIYRKLGTPQRVYERVQQELPNTTFEHD